MKQTLTHDIEDFISARINCSQLRLEDNTDYQEALRKIYTMDSLSVFEAVDNAIDIAEKSAYMLGLHDGFAFMAGLSS